MNLTQQFKEFFEGEKTGGIILLVVTILSLFLANSAWQNEYVGFWNIYLAGHTLTHWINDGLMTIFFLLIGLELEREIYKGELSDIKNAIFPISAALGGMILPATIFFVTNYGTNTQSGVGIPMATDIAFALGILSILGSRIPPNLKVFLTAVAVIDDLGAIIIIAIFYSTSISIINLLLALGIFGILLLLNRLHINNLIFYIIGGVIIWYFMLNSGVHATITGVLLAFAVPFAGGHKQAPSYKLEHFLHKPVAFFILPIFAIANTAITLNGDIQAILFQNINSIGIILGLVIGKPLGILLFSYISYIIGISKLPEGIKWKNILGVGFLAGIGFTMSIFITLLAFEDIQIINNSKIAIIFASTLSGILGYLFLRYTIKTTTN